MSDILRCESCTSRLKTQWDCRVKYCSDLCRSIGRKANQERIDPDDLYALLTNQCWFCKCCGLEFDIGTCRVDDNSVVCIQCARIVRQAEEDVDLLKAVVQYLEKRQESAARRSSWDFSEKSTADTLQRC